MIIGATGGTYSTVDWESVYSTYRKQGAMLMKEAVFPDVRVWLAGSGRRTAPPIGPQLIVSRSTHRFSVAVWRKGTSSPSPSLGPRNVQRPLSSLSNHTYHPPTFQASSSSTGTRISSQQIHRYHGVVDLNIRHLSDVLIRSGATGNLSVTVRVLLIEADHYNLSSLADGIKVKRTSATRECYILIARFVWGNNVMKFVFNDPNWDQYVFEVSENTARTYSTNRLVGCSAKIGILEYFLRVRAYWSRRTGRGLKKGIHWTLWALILKNKDTVAKFSRMFIVRGEDVQY